MPLRAGWRRIGTFATCSCFARRLASKGAKQDFPKRMLDAMKNVNRETRPRTFVAVTWPWAIGYDCDANGEPMWRTSKRRRGRSRPFRSAVSSAGRRPGVDIVVGAYQAIFVKMKPPIRQQFDLSILFAPILQDPRLGHRPGRTMIVFMVDLHPIGPVGTRPSMSQQNFFPARSWKVIGLPWPKSVYAEAASSEYYRGRSAVEQHLRSVFICSSRSASDRARLPPNRRASVYRNSSFERQHPDITVPGRKGRRSSETTRSVALAMAARTATIQPTRRASLRKKDSRGTRNPPRRSCAFAAVDGRPV